MSVNERQISKSTNLTSRMGFMKGDFLMSGLKVVKHTSDELRKMKSKTDWEWIKRRVAKGVEPDMTDPDDAEVTNAEFAAALSKRRVGRPKKASPKEHINLRVDTDIVATFRALGRGWQTRMNNALREYIKLRARSA